MIGVSIRKTNIKLVVAVLGATLFMIIGLGGRTNAAVDTCTWTGGGPDDNVSTAANWSGCDNGTVPQNGDSLVFPAATSASYSPIIDTLTSVAGITVNGAANPSFYSVLLVQDGSPATLDITGNITVGQDQKLNITSATNFTTDVTVTLATSDSTFTITGSTMDLGANTLTFEYANFASITSATDKGVLPSIYFLGMTSGLSAGSAGTSIVAKGVDLSWNGQGVSYTGDLVLNKSILRIDEDSKIGATSAGINMTNSQIDPSGAAFTIDEPLSISGNLFGRSGEDIGYEAIANPGGALNITNTTLLSDIVADPYTANITFSGSVVGSFLIGVSQVYVVTSTAGHLIISAATNSSLVQNGDYVVVSESSGAITDSQPSQSIIIQSGDDVVVNGTRANVIVSPGATLKGSGTVGNVSVLATGKLAPGNSPGCLNTGNLVFSGSSTMEVEINGATACTLYDRTTVAGSVTLSNATLSIVRLSTYAPALNTSFTIIDNDGTDAVVGTFAGLAQGATTTVAGVTYTISYTGGTGNDVVLVVTAVSASVGVPNTGVGSLITSPTATFIAAIAVLVAIGGIRVAELKKAKARN